MKNKNAFCNLNIRNGLSVTVDPEDFQRLNRYVWSAVYSVKENRRRRISTTIKTDKGYKKISLEKFIANPPAGKIAYALKADEGNYQKENIVICSYRQRQQMLPKRQCKCSSIYRGVSFSKLSNKWRASIMVDGRSMNLGDFNSELGAALAFNRASEKYFGSYGYLNPVFSNDGEEVDRVTIVDYL